MTFADQVADLLTGSDRIVTQYMHDWDGVMTEAAIQRVANVEKRDNSPLGIQARQSGAGRIRPSNLHDPCARLHALCWVGAPNDVGDTTLMDDGTQRHYYWQKVGLSAGFLEEIEVPVSIQELSISGSIDGLMVDGSIFEFKHTGPALYDRHIKARQPSMDHLMQTHAYMRALGVKKASVVYEKRSYGVTWHEFRIDWDQSIYDALVRRTLPVLDAVEAKVLPPMLKVCEGLSGPTYKGCDYRAVCPSATFRTKW